MSTHIFRHLRMALRQLNPASVREAAERPVTVGLFATSDEAYAWMEEWFAPAELPVEERRRVLAHVFRATEPGAPERFDVEVSEEGLSLSNGTVPFIPDAPERTVEGIVRRHKDLRLPLARQFPRFRRAVAESLILETAKENALFALLAATPRLFPRLASLVWPPEEELLSETAFMTVNEIRLAFLMAAVYGRPVGYVEQKTEIALVIAAAFLWRELARRAAERAPKALAQASKSGIAAAGTYAVGATLRRCYAAERGLEEGQAAAALEETFQHGANLAGPLLGEKEPAVRIPAAPAE
ncbi:MAG: hypothetical protein RMK57_08185 [Bryobacterales bacterium]|nr:hypothetical protein [Bryobacteraceae bacterium]MDW8354494.1 hypothetical protein [Bryobacterales bacterium]